MQYSHRTVLELKTFCRARGIKGYTKMRKVELVAALKKFDEDSTGVDEVLDRVEIDLTKEPEVGDPIPCAVGNNTVDINNTVDGDADFGNYVEFDLTGQD